jgi:hypothetical protein
MQTDKLNPTKGTYQSLTKKVRLPDGTSTNYSIQLAPMTGSFEPSKPGNPGEREQPASFKVIVEGDNLITLQKLQASDLSELEKQRAAIGLGGHLAGVPLNNEADPKNSFYKPLCAVYAGTNHTTFLQLREFTKILNADGTVMSPQQRAIILNPKMRTTFIPTVRYSYINSKTMKVRSQQYLTEVRVVSCEERGTQVVETADTAGHLKQYEDKIAELTALLAKATAVQSTADAVLGDAMAAPPAPPVSTPLAGLPIPPGIQAAFSSPAPAPLAAASASLAAFLQQGLPPA